MEQIKQAVREVLDERRSIDGKKHDLHHQVMEEYLQERAEKKRRRQRIRDQVAGWVIISTLASILGALGYAATTWVKSMKGGG